MPSCPTSSDAPRGAAGAHRSIGHRSASSVPAAAGTGRDRQPPGLQRRRHGMAGMVLELQHGRQVGLGVRDVDVRQCQGDLVQPRAGLQRELAERAAQRVRGHVRPVRQHRGGDPLQEPVRAAAAYSRVTARMKALKAVESAC